MTAASSPAVSPPVAGASARTVLIVEDERGTREAMATLLRRHGWSPTAVADAAAADAAIAACSTCYAAAVVDVHLPDGDGIELAGRIRRAVGKEPRVVVLSGDHSPKTLARLSDVGVDRFIGKPLSVQALLHALEDADDGIEHRESAKASA